MEKFNTHSEFTNSSLIFMNFSRGRVCKPGDLTHRKFGTTGESDPNVFVSDQEQARTMADGSICIQCSVDSKDLPPSSSSVSPLKELGPIYTG